MSESTIVHAAKHDIVPMVLVSNPPNFRCLAQLHQQTAAEAGRDLKLGERVGALRSIAFGDTEEEAVRILERTQFFGFNAYFAGFGFWGAFRFAEDAEKYPLEPHTPLPPEEWTLERMRNVKNGLAGTVDQVKREIESLSKVHGDDGNLEWFGWFFDQGLLTLDGAKRQMELFAEHIMPAFR